MSPRLFLSGSLLLFLAACGGDPPTGRLTGKVLFDGEPVRSGSLTFVDARGKESHTAISPEGTYRVSRLAVGPARIAVAGHARNPFEEGHPPSADGPQALPARYARAETSRLAVEVRQGEQKHDIVMVP
jgi:hypothetical protein